MNSRVTSIASWIAAVLIAAVFVFAGSSKLASAPAMVEAFGHFGYPLWFMGLTGALEIVGALLLVVPATARAGAVLLACIMVGAIGTLAIHGPAAELPKCIALLALCAGFLYLRGGFGAPFYTRTPRAGGT